MEDADKKISRLQWQRQRLSQLNQKRALSRSNSVITDSAEDNDAEHKDLILEDIEPQLNEANESNTASESNSMVQPTEKMAEEEQPSLSAETSLENSQDSPQTSSSEPAIEPVDSAPVESQPSTSIPDISQNENVTQVQPAASETQIAALPEPTLSEDKPQEAATSTDNNTPHPALQLLEVMESIDIHTKIVPTQTDQSENFLNKLLFGSHDTETQHNMAVPLTVVMDTCIAQPVQLQCELLNRTLLNLLMHDMKCYDHFVALRRYLLMHGGDFADNFGTILFTKVCIVDFLTDSESFRRAK